MAVNMAVMLVRHLNLTSLIMRMEIEECQELLDSQ